MILLLGIKIYWLQIWFKITTLISAIGLAFFKGSDNDEARLYTIESFKIKLGLE